MTCCMAFRAQFKRVLSIATLVGALILASFTARSEDAKPAAHRSRIENGEYLAWVGDCIARHTGPEGKLFASGLAVEVQEILSTASITRSRKSCEYGFGIPAGLRPANRLIKISADWESRPQFDASAGRSRERLVESHPLLEFSPEPIGTRGFGAGL